MEVIKVPINGCEVIIGQGNFTIYTIRELARVLERSCPGIEFGVAMNEAKPRLVRVEGNKKELKKYASEMALKIGGGHVFVIYMKKAFPIHVLNEIKKIPTVVNIYVATSNELEVIVEETKLGRAIVGVVDGYPMEKIENEEEKKEREDLLKKIGYGFN